MSGSNDSPTQSNTIIQKKFNSISTLLSWNRKFLFIGGIWPLEQTYIRATVLTIYLIIHLTMEYAELLSVFGDINAMVLSVLESVMQSMVLTKLIVFRHSRTLRKLIYAVMDDFAEENYANYKEKEIYLKYNYMAKLYYKVSQPYIICGASLYFFRPLITNLLTSGNSAEFFDLPFRTKLFFNLNDTQTYYLFYAYQTPMIYLLVCHNAWICLLITIVLHICGQLAIVEYRISNIKIVTRANGESQLIFRQLVARHKKSVWMAKAWDDTFHFVLLIDLVGTTLLLGLMSYVVITGSSMADSSFGYIYIVCIIATLFLLYGYCIVGQQLIEESNKIHEAFYQCLWYESSIDFRKALMICMMQTQEPLQMTAGKFFVFSQNGFADVLKSAMGYLSMLRKMTQSSHILDEQ